MKTSFWFFAFMIALKSSFIFADELKCDVKSKQVDPQNIEKLQVTFNHQQVLKIQLIPQVLDKVNVDQEDVPRVLYSRDFPVYSIRGGYEVSYCNPDESSVLEITKNLSVYSHCMVKNSNDKVLLHFTLDRKRKEGSYSMNYLGVDMKLEEFEFHNCQPN